MSLQQERPYIECPYQEKVLYKHVAQKSSDMFANLKVGRRFRSLENFIQITGVIIQVVVLPAFRGSKVCVNRLSACGWPIPGHSIKNASTVQ